MIKMICIKNPKEIDTIVYCGTDSITGESFIGEELFTLNDCYYIHKTDDIMRQVDHNTIQTGVRFAEGYELFDGDIVQLALIHNYTDKNKEIQLEFGTYRVKYDKISGFSFVYLNTNKNYNKKFGETPFTELSHYCWVIQEYFDEYSGTVYLPNNREDLLFLVACHIPFNSIDVSNITDMSDVFYNFDNTQAQMDISGISNWNVSNVTNMSGMFEGANIPNLDISKWDVSKVENMSNMFYMFRGSSDFDISEWDTSNVRAMEKMFSHSNIMPDISNWDVSNVIDMANMFAPSIIDCDISKWNVQSLRNFEKMFNSSRMKFPIEWLYRMDEKNIQHFINVYTGAAIRNSLVD